MTHYPLSAAGAWPGEPMLGVIPRALRVAIVLAGDGGGGMEKHATELGNVLAERGHEVCVIGARTLAPRLAPAVEHRPLDLSGSRHNPLALLRLYRQLDLVRPTIVHAHGNKAVAMVGMLRRFLPRASLLGTLHNVKRNVSMYRRMHACIAVSSAAAGTLRHAHRHVILNGIDAPRVRHLGPSGAWDGLVAGPRTLAAGRLVHAKGFDLLLEAWRHLDAPLAIAGDGPLRAQLQDCIDRHALADRVRLLGHRDDLPRLMSESALFVLSSRREGGPYTLVEALHHGVPAVCTPVGAAPDLVPARFVCADITAATIARAVRAALDDLPATVDAFHAFFDHARSSLTAMAMTEATEALYFATRDRVTHPRIAE